MSKHYQLEQKVVYLNHNGMFEYGTIYEIKYSGFGIIYTFSNGDRINEKFVSETLEELSIQLTNRCLRQIKYQKEMNKNV